jgi:hypothetical protein
LLANIGERFHKTVLDEFYRVAFRKKVYRTLEELQNDLDVWIESYNREREHHGKRCNGRTPYEIPEVTGQVVLRVKWALQETSTSIRFSAVSFKATFDFSQHRPVGRPRYVEPWAPN